MTNPPLDLEELKRLAAEAVCKPPWHGFTEPRDPSNRALALAAVNSLPALIAEVERLRTGIRITWSDEKHRDMSHALSMLRVAAEIATGSDPEEPPPLDELVSRLRQLKAEVERLRAENEVLQDYRAKVQSQLWSGRNP